MSSPTCAAAGGAASATLAAALQFFAASQCLVREDWVPNAEVHNESSWDFVIVGGGTAGAALAARLALLPGSVLLLEAGPDPPQESVIPGFRDALKGSEYDWNFVTMNDGWSSQALRGHRQHQPRGKMLGGSGSLNDMVYARGFPADYDEWATIVGDTWKWTTVLEYFKKTEHLTDERIINDPELMKYHGRGGDIEVAGLNESTHETDMFLKAFKELGFAMVKDMTYPELIGAGRLSHTIRDGKRDGSLTSMLNKAGKRDNLKVLKQALVTKILIENNTAHGVEVLINGEQYTFYVNKEVIVSAGTFNTAKLLLLSGLGPKEHLEEIGIEVVQDLPVGDNLHDHIMVLNYLAADNGTCHSTEAQNYMSMIQYLYDRTGPLSRTNTMAAYIEDPEIKAPKFAIYPVCMPMAIQFYDSCSEIIGFNEKICSKIQSELANHEILLLAVVLMKPESRGRVRLSSTDYLQPPLIYSGTFSAESDLDGYPQAMKVAWSVANTTYFKEKNARVIQLDIDGCADGDDDEAVRCRARAMATSAWHAVGTAAMGTVVDDKLKVKGLKGLRVADASVMPKVIRGNTNAPVIMIAERAAKFIEEQYYGSGLYDLLRGV